MKIFTMLLLALIAGCSGVNLDDYRGSTPTLDLKTFLSGELLAYGIVQDRSGLVTRKFTATIEGSWEGEQGTLVEHFIYDDGEEQDRVWHLMHLGNNRYSGTADDVVGSAGGETAGAVFNWQYSLEVPWRNDSIVLSLDDWLYLVDENHLINRTSLRKFGFKVGELTLVIEKSGQR